MRVRAGNRIYKSMNMRGTAQYNIFPQKIFIGINCNILQYRSVYFQKEADFKSKYLSNNTTSGFTVEQVVSVVR